MNFPANNKPSKENLTGLSGALSSEYKYFRRGSPYIKNYSAKDIQGEGTEVFCWAQDNRGMVYIGNATGIIEFDGREWKRISNSNNSMVRDLAVDSLGRVYVGANDDFGFLQPNNSGNLEFVSLAKYIPDKEIVFNDVWGVFPTLQGIYFCTNKYVFKYSGKKVSIIQVDFLVQDAYLLNKQLYLPTKSGTYLLNDTVLVPVSEKVGFCLTAWKGDQLLTVNNKLKLNTFNLSTSEFSPFKSEAQKILDAESPFEIERIDEKYFLISTLSNKIIIFSNDGDLVQIIDRQSGLMNGAVYNVYVDSDKNLWACMSTGIAKIDISFPLSKFGEKQNVTSNVLSSCFFDGYQYIGTLEGIYYLPPFDVNNPENCNSFIRMEIKALECWQFQIYNGQLYAICSKGIWAISGTNAKIIYEIDSPERGRRFEINTRFPDIFFLALKGKFVALKLGLNVKNNDVEIVEQFEFPEIKKRVSKITSDKNGNLWLNTVNAGVYFLNFEDNSLRKYNVTLLDEGNGIPNISHSRIYKVNNEIVLATGEGFFQPRFPHDQNAPDSLINFTYSTVFGDTIYDPYAQIFPITSDEYLITGEKVYLAKTDGGRETFDYRGFNRLPCSGIAFSSVVDSLVSICSEDGLFYYYFDCDSKDYKKSFNTIITKVVLNGDSVFFGGCFYSEMSDSTKTTSLSQNIEDIPAVDHAFNSVTFHFAALFFENPELTKFQYMLEGFDKKWSEWSTENKAVYTNLPGRDYTFKVKAENVFGTYSNIAEYNFSVSPPWYFEWWTYILYILILAGLIFLLLWLYTRRLKRQKDYLELIVEERTQEVIERAQELKVANEKLIEMDQFKQGVTNMIVHDLKNPINAIINSDDTNLPNQIEQIRQKGRQMLNMVMNILDVSKYEETNIPLNLENNNLRTISLKAIEQVLFLGNEKNIAITNHIDPELGIRADAEIIERVFVNILTNAIKYTPNNGLIDINAEMSSVENDRLLRVSIADNGIGIPADKRNLVFQKFSQVVARNSGSVRSTGLGLAYCKMVVEAHGGSIGVESELEKGSIFWFTLKKTSTDILIENATGAENETGTINFEKVKSKIAELRQIKFYEISKIRKVLASIADSDDPEIVNWRNKVLLAVTNGNEQAYIKLIDG